MTLNQFKNSCDKQDEDIQFTKQLFHTIDLGLILESCSLPLQNLDVLLASSAMLLTTTILTKDVINYANDKIKLNKLYKEFIKEYDKLNKTFNFNDPVQIYGMFNYLVWKGYLSKNKKFEFAKDSTKDIKKLYGANVITGQGVCRHIAPMLSDILNEHKIKSGVLLVAQKENNNNIAMVNENWTKDAIFDHLAVFLKEPKLYDKFLKIYEEKRDLGKQLDTNDIKNLNELLKKQNEEQKDKVNHVITFATTNEKNYFLDPTQSRIYRVDVDDKNIVSDKELKCRIDNKGLTFMYGLKDKINANKFLKEEKPTITFKDQLEVVFKTYDICKQNHDIFEKFYKDNCELYNDISNKMSRIRKI